MTVSDWTPNWMQRAYRLAMFVDVMDNLDSLGPEMAQSRLVNIYNTVGLVAALVMSVAMDPFLNPPECVAESQMGRPFFMAYGFILVSSVVSEFLAIVFCTIFLMVVYSVNHNKLLMFVKESDYVLGAPVFYALIGCVGCVVVGVMVIYSCYYPIFYIGLSLFVAFSLLPLLLVVFIIYSAFSHSMPLKSKLRAGARVAALAAQQPSDDVDDDVDRGNYVVSIAAGPALAWR